MDFTMGMKCPGCEKHNNFYGGVFGRIDGTIVNYNCECGFSAVLAVPHDGYRKLGMTIKFKQDIDIPTPTTGGENDSKRNY